MTIKIQCITTVYDFIHQYWVVHLAPSSRDMTSTDLMGSGPMVGSDLICYTTESTSNLTQPHTIHIFNAF